MAADSSPSALDRALLAIGKLRTQLETSEKQRKTLEAALRAQREPIAIVGMGCRFPGGATNPAAFWKLLEEGVDAVREIPENRWSPSETLQTGGAVRFAATLDDVERFDAEFFGISPREAVSLDPQQRLLLEVVWEALEDANLPADRLKGSDTGVFVGVWAPDYRKRVLEQDEELLDAYCYLGNNSSMVAGRVSYTFGFQGPSVAIDTACSSSLVAIHQACASLRAGESALAIAAGVGLLLAPESMDGLALLQALSPDGRCRTFDAGANGFVRGEGCGVVVLSRLSDAVRRGDRILGVIRGSAINQDGRSAGLTAPNVLAQRAVVQNALANAGLSPADIGYVEAHGTGTSLGDPIEVEALAAVLGAPRAGGGRCVLGSVKANIGHLEAAAGVAGVIKAVLVLNHERVPRQPNFRALNPRIALEGTALAVAAHEVAWPRGDVARRAGVSSFGMSGTNAHVILEESPPTTSPAAPTSSARTKDVLVLSGRSDEALRAQARRYAAHLEANPELRWADVCHTAAVGRSHFRHRLAVVAASAEDARERLARFGLAKDGEADGVIHGHVKGTGRPKVAFLFTGQGSQYVGMGRTLYATEPIFRAALDRCAALADPHLEQPLLEVMFGSSEGLLDTTAYTQVALFALEYALVSTWQSWGVTPDVVIGHSVGEYVAACVAGVFSLEDGVRLIAARGRLMQALAPDGAMASVRLSLEEASALVEGSAEISIAAHNGPEHTVLSGRREALEVLCTTLVARGVKATWLPVSHAFHSALIAPMLEAFERVFEGTKLSPPRLPLVSNVTGKLAGEDVTKVSYWLRHARETVRFAEGMTTLDALGVDVSIEIGPQPTLSALGAACLAGRGRPFVGLPSLRKGREEWAELLESVGQLYVRGVAVDWDGFDRHHERRRVALPTYAFQRERFWIDAGGKRDSKLEARAKSGEATGHPLLGNRVSLAGGKVVYETLLSRGKHAWVYDHRVGEAALMPGAGLAELVRAAGEHCLGEAVAVSSLLLQAPLVLPDHGGRRVQVLVSADADRTEVTVHSLPADASADAEWTLHASAEVRRLGSEVAPRLDLVAVRSRCAKAVDVAQAYEELAASGIIYGPAFRGLRSLWVGKDEALAEAVLPDGAPGASLYGIHPALLDAAFHSMLGISNRSTRHLPFAMEQVVVHAVGTKAAWVHARMRPEEASEGLRMDVTLSDAHGEVLVEVSGLRALPVKEILLQQAGAIGNAIHHVGWSKVPAPVEGKLSGRWVVVAAEDDATTAVVDPLRHAGAECIVVDADGLAAALPADHVVALWSRGRDEDDAAAAHRLASAGLSMVQLLAKQERAPRLWWVTRGAMPVTAAEVAEVAQASLWGLGRTVMQEHPELNCTLVDAEDAAALVRELGAGDEEREVAWRAGERYVARLQRPAAADLEPRALRTDGTVLITGGLGALGLHVARWLAQRGVPHLVLTGRRGLATPAAAEAVAELEAAGARVTVAAVDVSDRAAVRSMLATIPPELPLRGVVHAAGALDDGVLSEQSAERFARVMGPKVDGACHLDALTRESDLDVFVLFSSLAGTLGSAGQGGYAAANACLDALAARRRASGLPGQSLAWGLWIDATSQAAGMASGLDRAQQARLAKSGFGAIDSVQGMALMAAALERSEAQLVLTPLDVGVLRRRFGEMVPPLWRELVRVPRRATTVRPGAWKDELVLLPLKEREAAILTMVRGEVARALSLPGGDAVDPDRPLNELGLDSLMAVELRNALGRRVGASLPATLAFDHPTAAAIAKHILVKLGLVVRSPSNEPQTPSAPEEQLSAADALDFIRDEYERSLSDG